MLTGVRAFDAGSQAGIIAAILTSEPRPVAETAPMRDAVAAPAQRALDRLLRKCPAKKADARWQSAADLGDELRWIDEERRRPAPVAAATSGDPQRAAGRRRSSWPALTAALGIIAIAAIIVAIRDSTRSAPPAETIRFTIHPPPHDGFTPGPAFMSLSPDGRKIAFVTGAAVESYRMWVQSLESPSARPLQGTEGGWNPIWSPDSRQIAFQSTGSGAFGPMKKIEASDGRVYRIPAGGGREAPVTTLDASRQELQHSVAFALPGRRFVYLARSADPTKAAAAYLASLDGGAGRQLLDVVARPILAGGYVLVVQNGTLMAQWFDEASGSLSGDALRIVESVDHNPRNGRVSVSASNNGVLASRAGVSMESLILAWFDTAGNRTGSLPFEGNYLVSRPVVSPDGRHLAMSRSLDVQPQRFHRRRHRHAFSAVNDQGQ